MNFDFNEIDDGFGDEEEFEASTASLVEISSEVAELIKHIDALNEEIKELEVRKRYLEERVIPKIMSDMGMEEFKSQDGLTIKIKNYVSGSLQKAPDMEYAKQWFLDQNMGELFTTDLSLSFSRGQHNEAMSVKASLEESGLPVSVKEGIHSSTFTSTLRKMYESQKDTLAKGGVVDAIPFERLGAYHGTKAEIKLKKS